MYWRLNICNLPLWNKSKYIILLFTWWIPFMKLSSPASYLTSPRSCAADLKLIWSFRIFHASAVTECEEKFRYNGVAKRKQKLVSGNHLLTVVYQWGIFHRLQCFYQSRFVSVVEPDDVHQLKQVCVLSFLHLFFHFYQTREAFFWTYTKYYI